MKRKAVAGEFRSNLHRGGKAKKVRLRPDTAARRWRRRGCWGCAWPASI